MAYFEWGDDMSVGSAMIDDDHRTLIGLVNELHTATSRGEGRDVVGGIIEALITYTRDHFQREEHHMTALRYSKLAEHKRQHKELLEKVLDMQAKFITGHVTVAAQVSTLLRDWLSIHIRREDKEFAAQLTRRSA
ncbi:bacteriohemerythrin [Herbaspirillum sp. HC18]|nr:bacteriohemerythrin [Herbaspirillum sp. HC18]